MLQDPVEVKGEVFGKEYVFSVGVFAKQANGSVLMSCGNTAVLGAVTASSGPTKSDFFPLSVHYSERYYACGKIPGSFGRREGKPTDAEVLVCRMIDRPIRPLFPKGFTNEVQIVSTVLSVDESMSADIIGMNVSSACLLVSDIPFTTPVGSVRIAMVGDEFIVNPSVREMQKSKMDVVVSGTDSAITMIEGDCAECSEEKLLEALETAQIAIKELIGLQKQLWDKCRKEKILPILNEADSVVVAKVSSYRSKLEIVVEEKCKQKKKTAINSLLEEVTTELFDESKKGFSKEDIKSVFSDLEKDVVRKLIVQKKRRVDGRSFEELRKIDCRVDVLKGVHGSSLFTRGETQALSVSTIGMSKDNQLIDDMYSEHKKNFFLHYNFPPYCVGEVGRMHGVGRREIGHGMLAERSLRRLLPTVEEFPYTIRVVSEILESNGSSSMATICASSMSLMSSGVPLKRAVAGVAMGLVKDLEGSNSVILTDIQGIEDHIGDMDFKIAGTEEGVTAFQMDLKVDGVDLSLIMKVMQQAKIARLEILGMMKETISSVRSSFSSTAPVMKKITAPVEKIKNLIGPGGKNIKFIVDKTGSDINIEDDGSVTVFSRSQDLLKQTLALVEQYVGVPSVGAEYQGRVKRITNFGAFVEIFPGTDGLLHISEISNQRIESVEEYFQEGETVQVRVLDVDDRGRINLTMKEEGSRDSSSQERSSRGGRTSAPTSSWPSRGNNSGGGGGFDSGGRRGGPSRYR